MNAVFVEQVTVPHYVDLIIEWVDTADIGTSPIPKNKRKRKAKQEKVMKDVFIGYIPIMVFSSKCYLSDPKKRIEYGECDHDPGGYFIINGNEKVLLGRNQASKIV